MSVIATFDSMKQVNAAAGMLQLVSKLGLAAVHAAGENEVSSGPPTPVAEALRPLLQAVPCKSFLDVRESVLSNVLLKAWALHRFDYAKLHRRLLDICAGWNPDSPNPPMQALQLCSEGDLCRLDFSVLVPDAAEADDAEGWLLGQFAWLPGETRVLRDGNGSNWSRINTLVQRHAQEAHGERGLAGLTLEMLRQTSYNHSLWVDGRVYCTGDYIPYTNRTFDDLSVAGAELFSTYELSGVYAEDVQDAKRFLRGAGAYSARAGYIQPELPITLRLLDDDAPRLVVLRDRTFYFKVLDPDGAVCAVASGRIDPDCNPY